VVKKLLTHPLLWLLILGLFLRFYRLDTFPAGFHVDEVKAGWNAYSLFKTGRDDWLHAFPLHYDTFGDQRPTGFFYAAVPAVAAFGLNEFAVRFTPALFGSLGIVGIFFFAEFNHMHDVVMIEVHQNFGLIDEHLDEFLFVLSVRRTVAICFLDRFPLQSGVFDDVVRVRAQPIPERDQFIPVSSERSRDV